MIFKKKETKKEPNEIDIRFEARLRALEEETHQLISDKNFGRISEEEFEFHKEDIKKRIKKFKQDYENRYMDALMDNPMDKLDNFFGEKHD